MTTLVLTRWNGEIRGALEHGSPSKLGATLGTELKRIPLSPIEACVPISALVAKHGRQFQNTND